MESPNYYHFLFIIVITFLGCNKNQDSDSCSLCCEGACCEPYRPDKDGDGYYDILGFDVEWGCDNNPPPKYYEKSSLILAQLGGVFYSKDHDCDDSNPEINPGAFENCCDENDYNCDDILCNLFSFCSNSEGIECASPPTSRIRKIVFALSEDDENEWNDHFWNADLPNEWIPNNIHEVALIGCLEESRIDASNCTYNNGLILSRQKVKYKVAIFEANTGKFIDENTFTGGVAPCPPIASGNTSITSYPPRFEFAEDWVASIVNL